MLRVAVLESSHKESNASALGSLVVGGERTRPVRDLLWLAQCFELTLLVDRQEGHLACNKPVSLMEQLNEKNRGGANSPRFAWKTNITMEVMVICVNE